MLRYVMLAAVGVAGFAHASWWFVPAAAILSTIVDWRTKRWMLRRWSSAEPSTKAITYFVTGILADLGLAAVSYLLGAAFGNFL
jgi:hypothetical protein